MRIPFFQIDAFTRHVLHGNPAAVCLLETWPDDGLLQAVANENNLSETAFLVGGAGRYRLRWFTPTTEIDLCGHATLAAAFVLYHELSSEQGTIVFETRSGRLTASQDGERIAMEFPRLAAFPSPIRGLGLALGCMPAVTLSAHHCVAVFDDAAQVLALRPDMRLLEALDGLGVIATAPGLDCDYVCRVFAPKLGIPEDPVTGSAHCVLAPYWAERTGKSELYARHPSSRGGEVFCSLLDGGVRIGGYAVKYLEGELFL